MMINFHKKSEWFRGQKAMNYELEAHCYGGEKRRKKMEKKEWWWWPNFLRVKRGKNGDLSLKVAWFLG